MYIGASNNTTQWVNYEPSGGLTTSARIYYDENQSTHDIYTSIASSSDSSYVYPSGESTFVGDREEFRSVVKPANLTLTLNDKFVPDYYECTFRVKQGDSGNEHAFTPYIYQGENKSKITSYASSATVSGASFSEYKTSGFFDNHSKKLWGGSSELTVGLNANRTVGNDDFEVSYLNLQVSGTKLSQPRSTLSINGGTSVLKKRSLQISNNIYTNGQFDEEDGELGTGFKSNYPYSGHFKLFYETVAASGNRISPIYDSYGSGLLTYSNVYGDINNSGLIKTESYDTYSQNTALNYPSLDLVKYYPNPVLNGEINVFCRFSVTSGAYNNSYRTLFFHDRNAIVGGLQPQSSIDVTPTNTKKMSLSIYQNEPSTIAPPDTKTTVYSEVPLTCAFNLSEYKYENATSGNSQRMYFGHFGKGGSLGYVNNTLNTSWLGTLTTSGSVLFSSSRNNFALHDFGIPLDEINGYSYLRPDDHPNYEYELNSFFNKKYRGTDIFNTPLHSTEPSGDFMRLYIPNYSGYSHGQFDHFVARKTDGGVNSAYFPFNRYFEKPTFDSAILTYIDNWEEEGAETPQFNIWVNNLSTGHSGVVLKSKMYIPNGSTEFEMIGKDVFIPPTNGAELFTTPFVPSRNSLASGVSVPTSFSESGRISFGFEVPQTESGNIDVRFYSMNIDMHGYIDSNSENTGVPLFLGNKGASSNVVLYTKGHTPTNKDTTLYLDTGGVAMPLYLHNPVSEDNNSTNLYVQALESTNNNMPMFMRSFPLESDNLPLYLKNDVQPTVTMPMFLKNSGAYSVENNLATLFLRNPEPTLVGGTTPPVPQVPLFLGQGYTSGDMPLYINGVSTVGVNASSGDAPLYVAAPSAPVAVGLNKTMPMFLHTSGVGNNNTDLYLHGHVFQPSSGLNLFLKFQRDGQVVPLYMDSTESSNTNIPLYVRGGSENDNISLYLECESTPQSGSIPLHIWSTSNSGLRNTSTLYTNAANFESMNLFLKNSATEDAQTSNIPLYMDGYMARKHLELFLNNSYSGINDNTRLYTNGRSPDLSGLLPLYMARSAEAYATQIPMTVYATQSGIQSANLYISGVPTLSNFVSLFMSGQGLPNKTNELYTHGF